MHDETNTNVSTALIPENSTRNGRTEEARELALYTLAYAGFVLLLLLGGNAGNSALPDNGAGAILDFLRASDTLVWQFVAFGAALLGLHLLPLVLLLWSMRVASPLMVRAGVARFTYFMLAVFFGWVAALAYNKLHFPQSGFAFLLPVAAPSALKWLGGVSLLVYLLLGVLPAAWQTIAWLASLLRRRSVQLVFAGILAIAAIPPLYSSWSVASHSPRPPDVIVIGLDSFSPLHMRHAQGRLPLLEDMLKHSTVFSQTLTPLARTFPAWTGILTARYPVHSGARFNLTDFDQVDARVTLATLLRARGYATIYAQDERKFNNIDAHFGFDATVGPEPGVAEFVMTKLADQPLLNLSLLTPWANRLFPFVANNRAASIQYDPEQFVDAIVRDLPRDRSKPLFLATHFCLAHYPYTWRTQTWGNRDSKLSYEQKHIRALGVVEQQVARLLAALREQGRLDNAILVMLSDHGEAMRYPDGLWLSMYKPGSRAEQFVVDGYQAFAHESGFTGHGTQVLDRTQYQSLLLFRGYGPQESRFPVAVHDRVVSLVDVMPTLLSALDMQTPPGLDGRDLLAPPVPGTIRVIPTETGVRFQALTSVLNVDEGALFNESMGFYQVDAESARLIVKPDSYRDLVAKKDIALHTDDWILALLRKEKNPHFARVALLVHKPSGAWTLGANQQLIGEAPLRELRQAARTLYGDEIDDFSGTWAFR